MAGGGCISVDGVFGYFGGVGTFDSVGRVGCDDTLALIDVVGFISPVFRLSDGSVCGFGDGRKCGGNCDCITNGLPRVGSNSE